MSERQLSNQNKTSAVQIFARILGWVTGISTLIYLFPKLSQVAVGPFLSVFLSLGAGFAMGGLVLLIAYFWPTANVRRVGALKGKTDPEALNAMIEALKDPNRRVVLRAIKALEKVQDPKAIEGLITALRKEDEGIVNRAADALGRLKAKEAVAPLCVALSNGSAGAAEALGKIGNIEAVPALIRGLERRFGKNVRLVASTAARALAKIRDPRAIDPLISHVNDGEKFVSESAAAALGELGELSSVGPLIQALEKWEGFPKRTAAYALKKITRQNFGKDVSLWRKWWTSRLDQEIANWISELGRADLIPNPAVKRLQRVGNTAIPHLLRVLEGENADATVDAIHILKELRAKEAIPYLNRLATSTNLEIGKASSEALSILTSKAYVVVPEKVSQAYVVEKVSHGPDPVCPSCGTVYNRSVVVRLLREQDPGIFAFGTWTTKFKCKKCPAVIVISGRANE